MFPGKRPHESQRPLLSGELRVDSDGRPFARPRTSPPQSVAYAALPLSTGSTNLVPPSDNMEAERLDFNRRLLAAESSTDLSALLSSARSDEFGPDFLPAFSPQSQGLLPDIGTLPATTLSASSTGPNLPPQPMALPPQSAGSFLGAMGFPALPPSASSAGFGSDFLSPPTQPMALPPQSVDPLTGINQAYPLVAAIIEAEQTIREAQAKVAKEAQQLIDAGVIIDPDGIPTIFQVFSGDTVKATLAAAALLNTRSHALDPKLQQLTGVDDPARFSVLGGLAYQEYQRTMAQFQSRQQQHTITGLALSAQPNMLSYAFLNAPSGNLGSLPPAQPLMGGTRVAATTPASSSSRRAGVIASGYPLPLVEPTSTSAMPSRSSSSHGVSASRPRQSRTQVLVKDKPIIIKQAINIIKNILTAAGESDHITKLDRLMNQLVMKPGDEDHAAHTVIKQRLEGKGIDNDTMQSLSDRLDSLDSLTRFELTVVSSVLKSALDNSSLFVNPPEESPAKCAKEIMDSVGLRLNVEGALTLRADAKFTPMDGEGIAQMLKETLGEEANTPAGKALITDTNQLVKSINTELGNQSSLSSNGKGSSRGR